MKNFYMKLHVLIYILSAYLLINSSTLIAQINSGGEPMSSMIQLSSNFSIVNMPALDTKKLLEEDEAVSKFQDMPYRYGYVFEVNYNLDNSGTWQELSDGSRVWRLGIKSGDAMSLNISYRDFFMPKGATFFIYNLNKSALYGAFTELNNTADKQFATAAVPGNITILEYYEPVYSKAQGRIDISQIVHAYKDILGFNSVFELPCNININCPIGAPWVDQKRSVTRITFNVGTSGFLCSGSLVNNVLNNRVPYYLSAEHCASDNYSTMVFYFNYESPTCVGTLGSLSQTMAGAVVKAENYDTDFRLLQLNNPVPAVYNAYFNGWDKSGTNPLNQTAIHHPGGVIKKISVDENPAVTSNGFGGRLPGGFWQVVWEHGMTEGGSSGCPLYDQNKRVIGQNLGGTPGQCENPQAVFKVFGKFSESWAHGGFPTNQLKDWLDPNNSGVTTIDGIDDVTGIAPISNFTSNVQTLPIGGGSVNFYDLTTNGPTTWSWSFPGGIPSTSNERNPTGITYTATGAYTVSLTTTNAFGSNLKTIPDYIKVQGVSLNVFTLQSPPTNSSITVSQTDPTIFQFKWGSSNPDPTVTYRFKIKKVGPASEFIYASDNNGLDSLISFRKSFLDSLATTMGTTGDSVICTWRATSFNGVDSLTTNPFIVTIRRMTVGISQISSVIPDKFSLYNNYPNPFNPKTIIKFDVSRSQVIKINIYNILGEEITTLVNEFLTPGSYSIDFNANTLSSGMYFYRMQTGDYSETKRMVLVK